MRAPDFDPSAALLPPPSTPAAARARRRIALVATAGVLLLASWIWLQNAWLCDDAYITFRTVDNWVHGFGPRFNVAERVQGFTHPLWMLLLTVLRLLTGELYWTSLLLSGLLFVVMLAWVAWVPRRRLVVTVLPLALLLTSRSVVDFASSGLETPLTGVLLVVFVWAFMTGEPTRPRVMPTMALTALLALNRLDLLLLVLPAVGLALAATRGRAALRAVVVAAGAPLAWAGFSLLYYGFPLPNTAYAKLATGLTASQLAPQGLHYLVTSVRHDPLLVAIPLAVLWGIVTGGWRMRALAAGIVLYLAYMVRIGGDFMAGRLLVPPMVVAVAMMAHAPRPRRSTLPLALTAAVVAMALLHPNSPWRTGKHHYDRIAREDLVLAHGISDERGFYYRGTNPLWASQSGPMPDFAWANAGRALRQRGANGVGVTSEMGMRSYFAGPEIHFIDRMALTDPLLARLPLRDHEHWRIGHFARRVPPGYEATLATRRAIALLPTWTPAQIQLEDPGLAAYYRTLDLVVRGPVFSPERLRAVVDLDLGRLDGLLEAERAAVR